MNVSASRTTIPAPIISSPSQFDRRPSPAPGRGGSSVAPPAPERRTELSRPLRRAWRAVNSTPTMISRTPTQIADMLGLLSAGRARGHDDRGFTPDECNPDETRWPPDRRCGRPAAPGRGAAPPHDVTTGCCARPGRRPRPEASASRPRLRGLEPGDPQPGLDGADARLVGGPEAAAIRLRAVRATGARLRLRQAQLPPVRVIHNAESRARRREGCTRSG